MVKAKSSYLRRKDDSGSNTQDLETSKENMDVDKLSPKSDDFEDKDYEYKIKKETSQSSSRITRRITRHSQQEQNGILSGGRDNIDRANNSGLPEVNESRSHHGEQQDCSSSENDSAEDDDDYGADEFSSGPCNLPVRRSERPKRQVYPSYSESWMLGGGPQALGYHRGSRTPENDNVRRSGRLEAKTDFSSPITNGIHHNEDENEDTEEDMYSRVKKRRTSFSGRISLNKVENRKSRARSMSPIASQKDEEPVSRRLRDRNKLTLSGTRSESFGKESSNMKKFLRKTMRRKRRRLESSDSSSSSSSDSDRELLSPSKKKTRHHRFKTPSSSLGSQSSQNRDYSKKEMLRLREVQPIAVDPNISFKSVGGLDQFINKLKEIVLFPLLYNEFYVQKSMSAPRGILLHGPPGTGKTLLARALANECSNINGKKVSFFLRKGADLLNKFVGESERQLRLLFQQASLHQPSIIFFDEIDGLAPVRSAKSDQIHNSIVSTLLAELDGLQDRGQIIVLGSTNRLDFVDPALRRPGRFDCELPIFLPTRDGREEILKVHVAKWKDVVPEEIVNELADRCTGFNGADLKLLCWNASMNSLRRTYPQIYSSTQKYLLDYESIKVERDDWELALKSVTPSTHRSLFSKYSPAQPLSLFIKPLLEKTFDLANTYLESIFPFKSPSLVTENSIKRCLISAEEDSGIDMFIVPALLHMMETLPVHVLSYEALHLDGVAPEFSVTQICMEALKQSGPCVFYIPAINRLSDLLSDAVKEILIRMISQSIQKPIMILATVQSSDSDPITIDDELLELFKDYVLKLPGPSHNSIFKFLRPVFTKATEVKITEPQDIFKPLPLAPPESPKKITFTAEELKAIEKKETVAHRELRIFLREMLSKIVRNKKFEEFTKPVDMAEVPDYKDVIDQPMDLETMMYKVNVGVYLSAEQFLNDIKLIGNNCLQYNPYRTESDKRLRLRAYELIDFAERLIEMEMDSDFEEECKQIIKAREERKGYTMKKTSECSQASEATNSLTANLDATFASGSQVTFGASPASSSMTWKSKRSPINRKRSRGSTWARGTVKKIVKKARQIKSEDSLSQDEMIKEKTPSPAKKEKASPNKSSPESQDEVVVLSRKIKSDNTNKVEKVVSCEKTIKIDTNIVAKLNEILKELAKASHGMTVVKLLDLRFQLLKIVEKHQSNENKDELIKEIQNFVKSLNGSGSLKISIRLSSK